MDTQGPVDLCVSNSATESVIFDLNHRPWRSLPVLPRRWGVLRAGCLASYSRPTYGLQGRLCSLDLAWPSCSPATVLSSDAHPPSVFT